MELVVKVRWTTSVMFPAFWAVFCALAAIINALHLHLWDVLLDSGLTLLNVVLVRAESAWQRERALDALSRMPL